MQRLIVVITLLVLGGWMGLLQVQADTAADQGHSTFKKYCVSCHGMQGKGDGPIAATLDPKPANLSDKGLVGKLTDDQVANFIRNGKPNTGMLGWKTKLNDDQIHGLVAFIRSLSN